MNRWLRLVLAVLAGSLVAAPAVVHADTYTYDAGAIARVVVDVVGNVGRGPALVSDVREASALPPVGGHRASTPPAGVDVATEAASVGEDIVGTGHNTLRPTQHWINPSTVDDYAAQLRTGEPVSPIEVQRLPDGREFIMDGHHRYVASQKTGIPVPTAVTVGPGPVGLPDWSTVLYGG